MAVSDHGTVAAGDCDVPYWHCGRQWLWCTGARQSVTATHFQCGSKWLWHMGAVTVSDWDALLLWQSVTVALALWPSVTVALAVWQSVTVTCWHWQPVIVTLWHCGSQWLWPSLAESERDALCLSGWVLEYITLHIANLLHYYYMNALLDWVKPDAYKHHIVSMVHYLFSVCLCWFQLWVGCSSVYLHTSLLYKLTIP